MKSNTTDKIRYLDYLVDPSFQRVNRFFVISFEDNAIRAKHTRLQITHLEKVRSMDVLRVYPKDVLIWSST